MSASIIVKNAEQFQTSVWSGGTTTQLFIYPESSDYKKGDFQVRISSATVEVEKSEFTSLPGVNRYLMIFDGYLEMVHGDDVKVELEPYQVDNFDGGIPTISFGMVTDFNLMLKNGADGKMESCILKKGEEAVLENDGAYDLLAVYVREGAVILDQAEARENEMLLCTGWDSLLKIVNVQNEPAKLGICKVRTA